MGQNADPQVPDRQTAKQPEPELGPLRGSPGTPSGRDPGVTPGNDVERVATCKYLRINKIDGGEGQNRTVDTTIFSRMLYQLSYLAGQGSTQFVQCLNWWGGSVNSRSRDFTSPPIVPA